MAYDFHGKTALVTGAGRGIGKEIVKQLAKSGAKIYALDKIQTLLDALKNEMPEVETVCVDLADWDWTKKVVEELDGVDFLVNNAGIVNRVEFGTLTEESLDSIYSVNLKAPLNISQVVVDKLKKRNKPGSIVNVSSVASIKYFEHGISYSLSKASLDKLTKHMAIELAPFKIRVNSVNPTFVYTEMYKAYEGDPDIVDTVTAIPLKDICCVEDIANSVLFLLSDKARMITGTILPVDGGDFAK